MTSGSSFPQASSFKLHRYAVVEGDWKRFATDDEHVAAGANFASEYLGGQAGSLAFVVRTARRVDFNAQGKPTDNT